MRVLYALRDPGRGRRVARELLFVERMAAVFAEGKVRGGLELFLTPGGGRRQVKGSETGTRVVGRRVMRMLGRRRRWWRHVMVCLSRSSAGGSW